MYVFRSLILLSKLAETVLRGM